MALFELNSQTPKVRLLNKNSAIERFISTDELDCAVKPIKKVHILKNCNSSETSILLRTPSFNKYERSIHNDNNNIQELNYNDAVSTLKRIYKSANNLDKTDNKREITKESESNNQCYAKKNVNIYSVDQAKTIASQRRVSLPLANIPRIISHRYSDNNPKQTIIPTSIDNIEDNLQLNKDLKSRTLGKLSKGIGRLLRRSNSVKISEPDPVYKVAYLGNVLTGWARGENCVEKPLATLWRNYNQSTKPDVIMKLSITNSGLKGFTKEHGMTEYWSHRITYCATLPNYPKIFCWVYRHEGRKLKHELRCHAVLCAKESISKKITEELQVKLHRALIEFKKEKISKQNARMSLANSVYENPSMPRRKILLSIGASNYKPPLERSKSAPKLGAIEELCSEEDAEEAEYTQHDNKGFDTWSTKTLEDISEDNEFDSYHYDNEERKVEPNVNDNEFFDNDCIIDRNISSCNDIIELLSKSSFSDDKTWSKDVDVKEVEKPTTPTLVIDCKSVDVTRAQTTVIDSDDGSVSSGCETASIVTSSDAEPTSLPCQYTGGGVCEESNDHECDAKISVLQRVQSYEQIFRARSNSLTLDYSQFRQKIDDNSMICKSEVDISDADVVNHIPIGENNVGTRRRTYPQTENDNNQMCYNNNYDNYEFDSLESNDEVFRITGDSESACSDESGYSEYLELGKDTIIGNTVMV